MSQYIYIDGKMVYCPDKWEVTEQNIYHVYAPIQGLGYVLAVFERGTKECIGWILSEKVGYRSAKDYAAAFPHWKKDCFGW